MFDNYKFNNAAEQHSFDITNVDLAIINSIRRVLLSEIPVVGFYGEDEPTIEILFNNGPLHNEFMIHRVGLLPLNISPEITDDYTDGDYVFELNVENTGNNMINITTGDFKGKYKDKELTKAELEKIFPANKISKNKILITRLRTGEHLHLIATAIKKTGKTNASFSPVSLSNFYFVEDDKESATKDNVLDKHRSYYKNAYGDPSKINFQIESVNGFTYKFLFKKAIEILIEKLENVIVGLENKTIQIEKVQNCESSFNFQIDNEDDTLGNLIQSLIHNKYIRENTKYKDFTCTYAGYICPHPLKDLLIVRFTLEEQKNPDTFYNFFADNCKEIIKILNDLNKEWKAFTK
jgi:DNA-directed RNA polymerase subunit L